jgi:hypothetical protein
MNIEEAAENYSTDFYPGICKNCEALCEISGDCIIAEERKNAFLVGVNWENKNMEKELEAFRESCPLSQTRGKNNICPKIQIEGFSCTETDKTCVFLNAFKKYLNK